MATTVFDYMQKVKAVRDAIPQETENIIRKREQEILDLNRELQLYNKGVDSDGKNLLPYTPTTIFYKRQKGEVFNRTTLLDTGDFYKGFRIKITNGVLSIYSTDSKSIDLVEKYGNIFGLTKENEVIFNNEIIKPDLWEYIREYL